MADTSTVQSNSSSTQSSASGAAKTSASAAAAVEMSRGALLQKILAQQSFGLLLLRLVLGATMIAYGVPKFMGGAEYLSQVGSAMRFLGIGFGYQFFGLMAGLVEVVGGFMLIIGAYFRISCVMMAFVMLMASLVQKAGLPAGYTPTDFIMGVLHPLSMAGVFLAVMFIGPGRLSIQKV